MIITCINCNKKFRVDDNQIPESGREIVCGSCNYTWHFKLETSQENSPVLENKNTFNQEKLGQDNTDFPIDLSETKLPKNIKKNETNDFDRTNVHLKINSKKINKKISNFFSYLIVFIISFVALIILIDTIKSPLINIFPGLEIVLFSLFETLKDVRLFIIDLR